MTRATIAPLKVAIIVGLLIVGFSARSMAFSVGSTPTSSTVSFWPSHARYYNDMSRIGGPHRSCSSATTTALPVSSVSEAIDSFYQTQPYMSAFLTCSVKASAADFLSQKAAAAASTATSSSTTTTHPQSILTSVDAMTTFIKTHLLHSSSATDTATTTTTTVDSATTNGLDISRNIAFLCYGGIYQGLCEQFVYTQLFPTWFGNLPQMEAVILQVLTDVTLLGPLICMPLAYIVINLFTSSSKTEGPYQTTTNDIDHQHNAMLETMYHSIEDGLYKYRDDVLHRKLLFQYWAVWIPVQCLTFGVIPTHLRVAFIAMISFLWVYNLSSVATTTTTTTTAAGDDTETASVDRLSSSWSWKDALMHSGEKTSDAIKV